MSFLAPAFLLGLFAIGIPVLIHLSRRRTKKTLDFPSLMFIERVPYRSMRRRRLRDVLLLALRCCALALIAIAFARPLTSSDQAMILGEGREELVLLIDRSFSMTHGSRWTQAIEAAREHLSALGNEDLVTLVAFDESAEALHRKSSDMALVGRLLDDLRPSDRATRYTPALRLARRIALDSELPRRRVVIVTDLQRVGYSPDDGARLAPGVELEIVDVGDPQAYNAAISEVRLDRQRRGNRERIVPTARLVYQNGGEQGIGGREVELRLEVNGREIETLSVTLTGDGVETVRFAPLTLESGITTRGLVRILEDPLEVDNVRRFAFSPENAIPILLVDRGRRGPSSLYVAGALGTSEEPPFDIRRRVVSDLRSEDFAEVVAVVLHDAVHLLSQELRMRLIRFVEEGGGVFVALGPGYDSRGALAELGLSGNEEENGQRTLRNLAQVDFGHEIFAPFGAARSGDFSGAQFFRYRRLPELPQDAVLVRLDNGDAALIERVAGEGRILIWLATLDATWSDLVLQGVFVPWIDRAVRYLADYAPPRESYVVGQVAELQVDEQYRSSQWLIQPPAAESWSLGPVDRLLVPFDRGGFWEVRPLQEQAEVQTIAVNVDVAESDLRRLDPEEAQLAWSQPAEGSLKAGEQGEVAADPTRQKIWWAVLLLVLLVLVMESLMSNRRPGGLRARPREA